MVLAKVLGSEGGIFPFDPLLKQEAWVTLWKTLGDPVEKSG